MADHTDFRVPRRIKPRERARHIKSGENRKGIYVCGQTLGGRFFMCTFPWDLARLDPSDDAAKCARVMVGIVLVCAAATVDQWMWEEAILELEAMLEVCRRCEV